MTLAMNHGFVADVERFFTDTQAKMDKVARRSTEMLFDRMQLDCPKDTWFLQSTFETAVSSRAIFSTLRTVRPRAGYARRKLARDFRRRGGGGSFRYSTGGAGSRKLDRRKTAGGGIRYRRIVPARGLAEVAQGVGAPILNQAYKRALRRMKSGDTVLAAYLAEYAEAVHNGTARQRPQPWVTNALRLWGGYVRRARNEARWDR